MSTLITETASAESGIKSVRRRMASLIPRGVTVPLLSIVLLVALALVFTVALTLGPVPLGVGDVLGSVWQGVLGHAADTSGDWVVRELRLPRAVLAILVGAGLAVAGVATQGVFRNPLADPGLIGVSSGAALAAVAVIVLSNSWLSEWHQLAGPLALPLAAFLGGLSVTALMYRLGTWGGETHIGTLLLAGVAINVLAGAATGVLTYMADDEQLRTMTFWSMGSLAYGTWSEILVLVVLIGLPAVLCLSRARVLNALLMGENVANHLGFDVHRDKRWLLGLSAMMVGSGVAVAGMIGFIGLVVPHVLRLLIGPDHRALLPLSAIAGGLLLLIADTLARTWMAPSDIPVGLVMALIGGPVFLLLLLKQVQGRY